MLEIRFHGRGGQGAVTAAELLAQAVINEGRHAQGFPSFGAERRGAPVTAYLRVSDSPIRLRERIDRPDTVVILDPSLVDGADVLRGLRQGGTLILNTPVRDERDLQWLRSERWVRSEGRLALVDATRIAVETLGVPIVNTAMIGAVVQATGLARLESLADPVVCRFGELADRNLAAIRRAFGQTVVLGPAARFGPDVESAAAAAGTVVRGPAVAEALHAWPDLPIGCDVAEPGNTSDFHTGNWRAGGRPVTDYGRCTKCGICWVLCPDIAWVRAGSGFYDLDARYCKGCGACVEQCPRGAISIERDGP